MYKSNFIVAIQHEGKILRENGDEVYLPFGSQYSILLKNKGSRRALVNIEVDGENVLAGKSLIVEGNTSQEIKGFMRDMSVTNRFKFIHKTKEISDYRGDKIEDGIVTVNYTFEQAKLEPITVIERRGSWDQSDPYTRTRPWPDYYPNIKYSCMSYNNDDTVGNVSCSNTTTVPVINSQTYSDDGITVKGSKINQQYQYGDIGELENRSYTIILQLKGKTKYKKVVKKPLTVKTKLRCPTCGRKSKSSSQFCYNCGTYLERR